MKLNNINNAVVLCYDKHYKRQHTLGKNKAMITFTALIVLRIDYHTSVVNKVHILITHVKVLVFAKKRTPLQVEVPFY